ncbi:MAG: class I SAM-dependent methyltransferase, partial [Candidatus Omnitrophota bacterium]
MNEADRIKKAYEKRDSLGKPEIYSAFDPATLFIIQQREREVLRALKKFGAADLSGKKIADLGCGKGKELNRMVFFGALPENLSGIDLLPDRIESAKNLFPNIDFRCGNAESLPYENDSFDIILCFTVFSSIMDTAMKRSVAAEMMRVLKRGGIVLWYDF